MTPEGAQDLGVGPLDHDLSGDRRATGRPPRPGLRSRARRPGVHEQRRQPVDRVELLLALLEAGAAGVGRHLRFHNLRHTSVALAIAEGAHPKTIQSRMGHATISITLDRYGHLFPELDEAVAASFGERFVEARVARGAESTVVRGAFGSR